MWDTGRLAAESPLMWTGLRTSGISPGSMGMSMLARETSGSAMPCCCSCTRSRASCTVTAALQAELLLLLVLLHSDLVSLPHVSLPHLF